MRIRDPESFWPWIRDGIIQIRDKYPGSATLINTYRMCEFGIILGLAKYYIFPLFSISVFSFFQIPEPDLLI
jgi:hypothetical protein